jgi:hypothetical protein
MQFYWFVLGTLCVWRVTHLFQAEDGPGDVFVKLRQLAGVGFFGKLLDCFYCLSVWIAVPFALMIGSNWKEWLYLWLALSSGAILLERATEKQATVIPAPFLEEQEEPYALLRGKETTTKHKRSDSTGH